MVEEELLGVRPSDQYVRWGRSSYATVRPTSGHGGGGARWRAFVRPVCEMGEAHVGVRPHVLCILRSDLLGPSVPHRFVVLIS